MLAILQRLQAYGIDELPSFIDMQSKQWIFAQNIRQKKPTFFRRSVRNHLLIHFEYQVHCAQLGRDLFLEKATDEQIETALMLAELLEHIYQSYLIAPQEVERLYQDQSIYRRLLAARGYHFLGVEKDKIDIARRVSESLEQEDPTYLTRTHSAQELVREQKIYQSLLAKQQPELAPSQNEDHFYVTKSIREVTTMVNLPRLFILRLRRLLVTMLPFIDHATAGYSWVAGMDSMTNSLVPYVAWIFFTPRLITNFSLGLKHIIPGPWMATEERSLDWQTRFMAQIHRRWFEFANDLVWFSGGVVICFALAGGATLSSIYLGYALQVYDLILVSVRAYIEYSRLRKLEQYYTQQMAQTNHESETSVQLTNYLAHLHQRMGYEKKRLYISLVNNTVMVIAVSLALPPLVFNPVFALIGALMAVINTIMCYLISQYVEKQKPKNELNQLTGVIAHRFFKPKCGSQDPPILLKNFSSP